MNIDVASIKLIAMREWLQKVRERSFVIITAIQVAVVLALVLAPTVISAMFGDDNSAERVAIVQVLDQSNNNDTVSALQDYVTRFGQQDQVAYAPATVDDPTKALDEDGVDGVLEVTRDGSGTLSFVYTSDDGDYDQAAVVTYSAIASFSLEDSLNQAGIEGPDVDRILAPPQVTVQSVSGESAASNEATEDNFRYGVAYVSAVALYMVMLIYGMWVAQGVVVEKSSRIMEIMVNATSPTDLMFGKIIGIGMAGLTQVVPMLLVAGIGLVSQRWLADLLNVTGINLGGIDFGTLSVTLVTFFLIYFLLGFLLYASLYAGVGSLVSRQEDIQTVMTPLTFAVIAGFFGALFTLGAPDSMVARVIAIIPFTSPMAMVPRILLGDPDAWEIALSIALLAVSAYLAVILAARTYRMGVLMYGQKPSLKVIFQRDTIRTAR